MRAAFSCLDWGFGITKFPECILSVEDVAVALVDELENGKFVKQRFTAAY